VNLLTVVAVLKAKPGKEKDLRDALLAVVGPTRGEAGCKQYDLHESTDNPGEFVFYENWTDREALNEHSRSPHIETLRARVKDVLAEPADIRTYTRLA
jgi:quinol monooxygenase YgiN